MNPAILNYLQSQQGQTQGGGQAPSPQMQPMPQQQAPYNPFDTGIRRAIESARESLGMTEKQQDKALRRSLLTFGENIGQQPKQRGLLNNFASAGRALGPAIMAHDEAEEQSLGQNNVLANQILGYKAAEEAKQAQAEQQQWGRGHAEEQLAEQKRYHNLMDNFRKESLQIKANKQGNNIGENGLVEGKYPAFASKTERTPYAKTLKGANHVIGQVDKVLKGYEDFEQKYPDSNSLLPYGIGATISGTKNLLSNFSNDENLKKEVEDRAKIKTLIGSFTKQFEKDLKGGILTDNMVKRFEKEEIIPVTSDSLPVIKAKLAAMRAAAEEEKIVSTYSLQKNAHVNIGDLNLLGESNQQEIAPMMQDQETQQGTQANMVIMQDTEGNEFTIPANDIKSIEDALNDGLTKIQ